MSLVTIEAVKVGVFMGKIKEVIDYNYFDDINLKKIDKIKTENVFTFFTEISENLDFDIKTVKSILNQTFIAFEWIILTNSSFEVERILKDNGILDERIKVVSSDISSDKAIVENFKSQYLINVYMGAYLNCTFLDTIYSNIILNKDADIIFTNSINYLNHTTNNECLHNFAKREINLFTSVFCYRKDLYYEVLQKTFSSMNIIHLNYYGVYESVSENNIFNTIGYFKNYPQTCSYYYNSEPYNISLLKKTSNYNNAVLCFMPWAKIGGADLFNLNVMKYLKLKGYSIIVVTTEFCDYEARESFENVVDAYYDLSSFLPRQNWPDFIKSLIECMDIKLIFQMNSLYTYHLLPWIKYYFPKLPIIDYLHAEDFSWRNGGYPKDSTAMGLFIDKTFTCSNHLKELMGEKMNRDISDIETIYIGVDTDKYDPQKTIISDKETEEFCKNKKVILFPSRFSYEKRPLFLLNLMNKLKDVDDIVCLMVGDGAVKKDMQSYIANNNLQDKVKLIPMQKDIRQYYKMANVVCICSLTEGITLTTYEALSMNVPVISADVGGQSEVVNDKNGIIIKRFQNVEKDLYNYNYSEEELGLYEQAVLKIFNNPKMYKDCRKHILNGFSQKNMLESIEKRIRVLIKSESKFNAFYNVNFAIRYIVLFNEASKEYYKNSFEYNDFKLYLKNKLWQKKWWRVLVKFGKKMHIDSFIKKIYFKEK